MSQSRSKLAVGDNLLDRQFKMTPPMLIPVKMNADSGHREHP